MTSTPSLEHVSIPPESTANPPPAVVLLHGRGAHERDLLPLRDRLPDAFHVLSVRAPDRLGPGYTWYELDLSGGGLHASEPHQADFDRSLDALDAFIDEVIERYAVDPRRIGLLGFSQGAILGLSAMIEHPGRYHWIAALHGYLPERYGPDTLAPASGVPVFLGAGTHDDVIPASRAEDAAERLDGAGAEVTFRTYPIGHGIAGDEIGDVSAWVESYV